MTTEIEGPEDFDARRKRIIERLRKERQSCAEKWRAVGVKYGFSWAERASYPELVQWSGVVRQEHLRLPNGENDRILELRAAPGQDFDRTAYIEGWLAGMKTFWQDVKEELKDKRGRRLGRDAE